MWRGSREIHSTFLPRPCQLLGGQARRAAMVGVFLVSAVVHEYIFCFVLGFFYPVMLILFLVIGGELGLCVQLEGNSPRGRRPVLPLLENPGPHTQDRRECACLLEKG